MVLGLEQEAGFGVEIPSPIRDIIDAEVDKDASLIEDEDPETAELLRAVMPDIREQSYKFLKWVDGNYHPSVVLYPASGFDMIPKLAFGPEKVIHTSIEDETDGRYFDGLGEGNKIIADNNSLPFAPSTLDLICILDGTDQILGKNIGRYIRLLKDDGLIALSTNIFDVEKGRIGRYEKSKQLKSVLVPGIFQEQGESESKFYLFQKLEK